MRRMFVPAALAVAALAGACGEPVAAPSSSATLVVRPRWPDAVMANAVFGAGIDSVRIIVSRQNEETAASAELAFPARDEGLRIGLDVPLRQRVETLWVYLDLYEDGQFSWYGSAEVVLRAGAVPAVPDLPLAYFGPGSDAVSLAITPTGGRTGFADTLFFTTSALNGQQQPVTPPVAWALSDSSLATISAAGRFISGSREGQVRVIATTPTGLADTVTVDITAQIP